MLESCAAQCCSHQPHVATEPLKSCIVKKKEKKSCIVIAKMKFPFILFKVNLGDFPGGPVVKNLP